MAQYCRYCEFICKEQNELYCPIRDRYISEKSAKHTNECESFKLNTIDAIRKNTKGYNPTGVKPIELGGLGKQIKMDEIIKEIKK